MKKGTDIPITDKAILIVGDPGSRKTTLALHFPSPYIFDIDGNLSAPVERTKITNFYYDKAQVDDDGNKIHPMLQYQHMIKCLNAAAADPNIKTIVVDSVTTLVDMIIAEVFRQEYGNAATTDAQRDAILATKAMRIQDWGKFAAILKHLVMTLRTTDKIIVFIAHNRMEKDEADGKWKIFLNVPGQNQQTLSGLFTDCLNPYFEHTGVGNAAKQELVFRTMPVSATDHRGVKSSFISLPNKATWDQVLKCISSLCPTK